MFLTEQTVETLRQILAGRYELEADHVHLIIHPLRGDAVASAVVVDDHLTLVVDLDKPNAMRQAREMLCDDGWRLFEDAAVQELNDITQVDRVTRVRLVNEPSRRPGRLLPLRQRSVADVGTDRLSW